jgi:hypothetical protein
MLSFLSGSYLSVDVIVGVPRVRVSVRVEIRVRVRVGVRARVKG